MCHRQQSIVGPHATPLFSQRHESGQQDETSLRKFIVHEVPDIEKCITRQNVSSKQNME